MEDNQNTLSTDAFERSTKSTTTIIPEHFKTALAVQQEVKVVKAVVPAKPAKTSADLQKELDQLNAERQARLQALLEAQRKRKQAAASSSGETASTTTVAAPQPLTFGTSKRRRM